MVLQQIPLVSQPPRPFRPGLARPDSSTNTEDSGFQAPRYTTSTRRSVGRVDVVFEFNGHTFGHSVDARVREAMLQRIAGNATQTTFERYWVPIVVEGEDRIGTLCSQDRICFCPATSEDIRKITDPRTLARTDDAQTEPPAVVSRTMKPNYLAQQVTRRPFQP